MRTFACGWTILTLALALFLQGCATGYAPVTDRSLGAQRSTTPSSARQGRDAPLPNPGFHVVQRGDTLYSISWRYGLDYREVAQWNGIDQRFQIFPGQRLTLIRPAGGAAPLVARAPAATQPQQTSTAPTQSTSTTRTQDATNRQNNRQTTAAPAAPEQASGAIRWRWPANGPIIRRFSDREGGNKGIDIAGREGEPVHAAADGRVVYAGSGLLGYGNLVIINHNREFLSAYAHNSRLLVSENDMVKGGDKIAEMGSSGTDRVQLHFEIRRNGKPVNPLTYLPAR